MSHIKLPNENYIESNIFEVTAFPKANLIDKDERKAFEETKQVFDRIVFEFHKMGENNKTAAELLWISESVENQTFKSRVRLFVILRNIGNNLRWIKGELSSIQGNIIYALNQSKFDTSVKDVNDNEFLNLIKDINCSSNYSVVKSEKAVGNNISQELYYSWDILNTESDDSLSGLISSISQNRNCAVSFQIIPTALSDFELNTINDLSAIYAQSISYSDTTSSQAMRSNQYVLERGQQPLFYYSINVFGDTQTCRIIATKLISLLQSGKQENASCDLITLDLSRERIDIYKHFYAYPWIINEKLLKKYRNPTLQQYQLVQVIGRMPYLMTGEELNVFFRLPLYDNSMPALIQKRGGGDLEQFDKEIVGENTIKIGELVSGDGNSVQIGVPMKSWTQHALIVGMPGTGKTTFAVNILTQFAKKGIPFLAIEPTKAEYRAMIDAIDDLQIFTPGNNEVSPFIINPFIPPNGITVEQYTPSLLNAFKAAFSMDGPLEMIFLAAINDCYTEYGWKKNSKLGDEGTIPFGMFEYILCFKRKMKTMNYGAETKGNIETAGLLRLMNLIEQNSNIYDTVNTIPIEDLLSKPTVLELNAIDNEEQKALIMSLLLSSICVHTKNNQKGDGQLKNVILIDEAHVLLDSGTDSENSGSSKNITVKTIQKMIAEIRSYGTSIIIADQKPSAVTESIVSNTNVKISFRITSSKERTIIAESTDMSEANAEYLSRLGLGQAFVYFDKLNSPQLVQTKDTRKADGIRLSVPNEEIAKRSVYWKDKAKKLIPFMECKCSKSCERCSFKIRNDAEYFSSKLYGVSSPKIKEKKNLVSYACHIPVALAKQKNNYSDTEFELLCNCTIIKYIRKAKLNMPYTISQQELSKILELSKKTTNN